MVGSNFWMHDLQERQNLPLPAMPLNAMVDGALLVLMAALGHDRIVTRPIVTIGVK